ncbi:outer membrane autotransporter protein [Oceanisphaera litoralis]|uniref:autotransporter family protein n=1 Tax=Oceanisphaera litoralis TaxID=225144 RepID=UPI001955F703|nr:autotransporter outer membrane beta-barrel domain-containing protein [Oceanisphaera litoralis]MBM7456945.1 outer membrane autotransporter protein [Oceanisphaera litoralis]
MTFKKSQLAMAVAVAISFSAQAQINNSGSIYIDGSVSVGSANAATEARNFVEEESPISKVFEKAPSGTSSVYLGDGESLLEIRDGELNALDMDLQNIDPNKEEFLSTGSESTFVIDNVTSAQTLIETNGAHIEHNGSAAAIAISNSNLTGIDFDIAEGDEPIPENLVSHKELITNNGGEIVAMGLGNAIDISNNSTINGLIINEDWGNEAENTMKGGFIVATKGAGISLTDSILNGGIQNVSRQDAAKIVGGRAAIELNNSTLDGYIVNEHSGENQPIGSQPIILGKDVAIAFNNSRVNGGIKNEGIIVAEGIVWYDETTGNNTDEQFDTLLDSKLNGVTPFDAQGNAAIQLKDGTVFNGNIDNSGIIAGGHYGINIADDVTGNITINQLAGELNGTTALRMNKITRTNYTGGKINGNVENHGGTFYVEGNQSIAGDYMQTEGSTLAMGLHKETSLSANNIDLAEGSKVLIDLSKGDLYVQNGDRVELLKGKVSDTGVNYSVKSGLVTVASTERNDAGNLVLVFDRTSYEDAIEDSISGNTGSNTEGDTEANTGGNTEANNGGNTEANNGGNTEANNGGNTEANTEVNTEVNTGSSIVVSDLSNEQIKNIRIIGKAFDELRKLPNSSPAVEKILKLVDEMESREGILAAAAQLLPDVSGASVAGAMNASSQSGAQISVRARGLASGDAFANSGLWIQALASDGEQDNRHGDGYKTDSHGFVLGADTELNSGLVLGAAYSFINSESDTANSSIDSDYHMATAYAAQSLGQVLIDGQAYYAWGDNDSQRNIGARANYDSNLVGARVGAGYQFELGQATRFVPSLSLEASRLSVDGYTETGSPAALSIGKQDFNRLELGLSTELSKDYQINSMMVTPSLTLGAFHDFEAEAQASTVAFAAAPAETFTVTGRDPEKNRYVAGVGLDIMSGENLTVSAEYNYNWNGDGFDANAGALKFRWDF